MGDTKREAILARACAEYVKKCHAFLDALLKESLTKPEQELSPHNVKEEIIKHSRQLKQQNRLRGKVEKLTSGKAH